MMLLSQIEIVLIIAANAITNYPGILMYEGILITTFWPWFVQFSFHALYLSLILWLVL